MHDVAAILGTSRVADLNTMEKDGKNSRERVYDCIDNLVFREVTESKREGSAIKDSCILEEGSEGLEIEVFGDENIYMSGEVGEWKGGGWDSQIRNAIEQRRGTEATITENDNELDSLGNNVFEKLVDRPAVPQEYDRKEQRNWTSPLAHASVAVEAAEIEAFGRVLGFPIKRRSGSYRRTIIHSASEVHTWFTASGIKLGAGLTAGQELEAESLRYTWRDLFTDQVKDMPVPDLLEHRIPIYHGAQPRRARDKLYTKEEQDWLELNIPKLEEAGIIARSESPWAHRIKFVRKKDRSLRMVHVFCPINSVTMLSGYPTKCIEPVVNNLMQARFFTYFQADASNRFWAVHMDPSHAYCTAFSTHDGQWQYLRMGQGLAGAP